MLCYSTSALAKLPAKLRLRLKLQNRNVEWPCSRCAHCLPRYLSTVLESSSRTRSDATLADDFEALAFRKVGTAKSPVIPGTRGPKVSNRIDPSPINARKDIENNMQRPPTLSESVTDNPTIESIPEQRPGRVMDKPSRQQKEGSVQQWNRESPRKEKRSRTHRSTRSPHPDGLKEKKLVIRRTLSKLAISSFISSDSPGREDFSEEMPVTGPVIHKLVTGPRLRYGAGLSGLATSVSPSDSPGRGDFSEEMPVTGPVIHKHVTGPRLRYGAGLSGLVRKINVDESNETQSTLKETSGSERAIIRKHGAMKDIHLAHKGTSGSERARAIKLHLTHKGTSGSERALIRKHDVGAMKDIHLTHKVTSGSERAIIRKYQVMKDIHLTHKGTSGSERARAIKVHRLVRGDNRIRIEKSRSKIANHLLTGPEPDAMQLPQAPTESPNPLEFSVQQDALDGTGFEPWNEERLPDGMAVDQTAVDQGLDTVLDRVRGQLHSSLITKPRFVSPIYFRNHRPPHLARISTKNPSKPFSTTASYNRSTPKPELTRDEAEASFIQPSKVWASEMESKNVRDYLKLWQEQRDNNGTVTSTPSPYSGEDGIGENMLTQSGEIGAARITDLDEDPIDEYSGEFDSPDDIIDIVDGPVYLQPGDMVEVLGPDTPYLAIFVKKFSHQAQLFTTNSSWIHISPRLVRFAVPHFVSPNELEQILPFLPSIEEMRGDLDRLNLTPKFVPRGLGANLVMKMRNFHLESDRVYRAHADRLNRVREIMVPEEESSMRTFKTLDEIAMKVFQRDNPSELRPSALWAVHRVLLASEEVLHSWRGHRSRPVFEFLPQQIIDDLSGVQQWIRTFQEASIKETMLVSNSSSALENEDPALTRIRAFCVKARKAIEKSRLTRPLSPSGAIGPSSIKVEPVKPDMSVWRAREFEALTSEEKKIVEYMNAWASAGYLKRSSTLRALGPMILRAVGMYEDSELGPATGYLFLQELGLVAPWQNRRIYKSVAAIPDLDLSHPITELHQQALQSLSGFAATDSMKSYRKDWGDLPVFCVDAFSTTDRDDGISIQMVDDDPSVAWIHIHIANPSAFIAPDSPLARYAAALTQTIYMPESKYLMLDRKLVDEHFSLGKDRSCLTFSAKLNSDGEILEKQITPGVIHNVYYARPQKIMETLGFGKASASSHIDIFAVGASFPEGVRLSEEQQAETERPFTPDDVQSLRKLRSLSEATYCRRIRDGGLAKPADYDQRVGVSVYLSQAPLENVAIADQIRHFDGDPSILIDKPSTSSNHAYNMVEHLMILAGEICALWCMERNIPIPYRGMKRDPRPDFSPEEFKRDVIDPQVEKTGTVAQSDAHAWLRLYGTSMYSATPLEHVALGLSAYCKTTSPIRRYIDLCIHWQIEAALRHEEKTGMSLVGSSDHSYLPLSLADIEEISKKTDIRERSLSSLQRSSERHWNTQAVFRAFYFKEAPLPETFTVSIIFAQDRVATYAGLTIGWVEGLAREVHILDTPLVGQEGGFESGHTWECKISTIDPYYSDVVMEPVRKISA